MSKQVTALWYLNSADIQIKIALDSFKEFLNTGNRDYLVQYGIKKFFIFCYIQISDYTLMPEEDIKLLEKLVKIQEQLKEYDSPVAINSDKVLEILYLLRKENLKLFWKEIERNHTLSEVIKNKDSDDFIKSITNYSDNYPEFIPNFKKIINTLE